jgi:hypothetical protein
MGEIAAKRSYDQRGIGPIAIDSRNQFRKAMRHMITKLGHERKRYYGVFIVLMMMLLVLSQATPANAISVGRNSRTVDNCELKCTAFVKVTDNSYQNERNVLIYSFKVGGVKKYMYAKYTQDCINGHYSRNCTPFARCKVNKLCEQSGPLREETKGYWEECTKWDIADVWIAAA